MVGGVKIAGAKNRRYPALPTHQFAETLGTELEARIGKQGGDCRRQAMDHMVEIGIKGGIVRRLGMDTGIDHACERIQGGQDRLQLLRGLLRLAAIDR